MLITISLIMLLLYVMMINHILLLKEFCLHLLGRLIIFELAIFICFRMKYGLLLSMLKLCRLLLYSMFEWYSWNVIGLLYPKFASCNVLSPLLLFLFWNRRRLWPRRIIWSGSSRILWWGLFYQLHCRRLLLFLT